VSLALLVQTAHWRWLNNDWVNAAASSMGALVTALGLAWTRG